MRPPIGPADPGPDPLPRTSFRIGLPLCAAAAVAGLALRDDGVPGGPSASADASWADPALGGADDRGSAPPERAPTSVGPRSRSGVAEAPRGARGRAARPQDRAPEPEFHPGHVPTDSELAALAAQIPRQTSYPDILRLLHRLGGDPEDGSVTDRHADGTRIRSTRFQRAPARMADLLDGALAASRRGVVRQALIFHLALALPPDLALPRLRSLAASADPDDAEDALCALAFTGDEAALARFEELARDPTTCAADVRVGGDRDEARLFRDGRRDVLRSYRSIEALDRAPYFHIHGLWMDGVGRTFPWAETRADEGDGSEDAWDRRAAARPAALVARVLPAWLRRYPGHAGSDDMAHRMAQLCVREGRDVEALRWASLGATVPDGDMLDLCLGLVVSLVEFAPAGSRVVEDVIDPAATNRNRNLLLYLRLRRHAQDFGFGVAVREAADLASAEPHLLLSAAWNDRWSAPVPLGLDSGLAPLPADDPLRRAESPRGDATAEVGAADVRGSRGGGTPWLEPLPLRRQFRAWETMAALEERRSAARGSDEIDLLYKEAAVHFHDRDVLYPAYASHDEASSGRPSARLPGRPVEGSATAWLRGVLSWELAARRFEEVARLDPQHPLADDAIYSAALAHVKAADDRAVRALGKDERERHLRAAVGAFQDLVARWPESPLAASAAAALAHWRRAMPGLF